MNNFVKRYFIVLILGISITIVLSIYAPAQASGIQKKLINFQGYLTDNANPPIPLDGTHDLTFRIYAESGALTPIWTEHHQGVTVINGNVSVLLGSITDMNLVFDEPRYLGIQVGNEPEMTPRQRLLPSFQATSANKLNVTYANENRSEFGVNNIVPIGGIISYFGDPANLPENWAICDGSTINDPQSPLNGRTLPDLRAKFVRGEEDENRDIITSGLNIGGNDTVNLQHSHEIPLQNNYNVTTSANGAHDHGYSTSGAIVYGSEVSTATSGFVKGELPGDIFAQKFQISACYANSCILEIWGNRHNHNGTTNSAGSHTHVINVSAHDHGGTTGMNGSSSQDIRPEFVALHYIIRIK